MRKLIIFVLLWIPLLAWGQIPSGYVQVTATVPSLANGTFGGVWTNLSNSSQLPLLGGVSAFQQTVGGKFDSNGFFSVQVAANNQIIPTPSTWNWTFTFLCTAGASTNGGFMVAIQIIGGGTSQDISTAITASLPSNPCSGGGGGGGGGVSPPAFTVQAANGAATSLTSDPAITINTATHTFLVGGPITTNAVTIGPHATPVSSWTFDTFSPATACSSIGCSNGIQVPVELFGAVGDWNGTTGTDNTTAIQNTINSLTSGCALLQAKAYKITAPLLINKSNVGICGVGQGYGQFTLNPQGTSTLMQTTASADIIDILGPSLASPITWTGVTNVALERSVLPTGTAKGLSVKYAAGYLIRGVTSQDSIYDFWFHGAPQYVTGGIFSANAGWGGTGSLGTYTASVYGFFLDSAGGEASGTFFADNISATNSTGSSGFTSTAVWLDGNAINDVFINQASSEATSYGAVINCTATTGIGCQDIHFTTPVFDQFKISGIQINNLNQGAHGATTISDGWIASSSSSGFGIDCEGSSGLNVTHTQIQTYGSAGFHASGCQGISVTNNTFTDITGDAIDFFNTGNSNIIGNVITSNANSGTSIFLGSVSTSGSNNNVVVGNNLSQINGTAVNGLYFDSHSQFNMALNNKYFGTYTTLITNLGTSNGIIQQTNTGSISIEPSNGNMVNVETLNNTAQNVVQNLSTGTAAQAAQVSTSDTVSTALVATSSTFTGFNSRSILAVTGASELDFVFGGVNEAHIDSSGNIASGTNIVYRCATAGATLPAGSLTITAAACGSTTDTGLRVK